MTRITPVKRTRSAIETLTHLANALLEGRLPPKLDRAQRRATRFPKNRRRR